MEANIGKTLREARTQKNLSVEEVARVTRIPKARIVDLENDDYSRFPSLAYARGFLVLYARFLNVDRSKYAQVDVGSPVALTDYQYLQHNDGVSSLRMGPLATPPPRRKVWLKRIGIFSAAIIAGIISALAVLQWNRLPSIDQLVQKRETPPSSTADEGQGDETPAPTPAPKPTATAETPKETRVDQIIDEAIGVVEGESLVEMAPAEPGVAPSTNAATSGTSGLSLNIAPDGSATPPPPNTPVNASAEVAGPPPDEAKLPPLPADAPIREIKISANKRTRVKIYRDNAQSQPVFDDWLRRGAAVSLKGKHFWIETREGNALKITSDGKPVSTAAGANNSVESGVEIK